MSKSIKLRFLLWVYNNFKKLEVTKLTPQELRAFSDDYKDTGNLLDVPTIPLYQVENRVVAGRESPIPIRIFTPSPQEDLPVIVFFHGGGFVIGTLDTHDNICRRLSRDNEAIVVSVDYRLAPEYKYPAAPNDCYDATLWVSKHCKSFGGNPAKLVVMGDSAGGNLATVVSLMARDKNTPQIAFQVLVYPCTDARLIHPSIKRNGKGYILTSEMMDWFLDHYIASEDQKREPYLSPYLAADLTELPPALIQIAEFDPLRDEGEAYAQRLIAAGNKVILTEYKGLVHTYFTMPKFLKDSRAAYMEIRAVLSNAFS